MKKNLFHIFGPCFSKIYGPAWSGPVFRLVTFSPVRVLENVWSGPGFSYTLKIILRMNWTFYQNRAYYNSCLVFRKPSLHTTLDAQSELSVNVSKGKTTFWNVPKCSWNLLERLLTLRHVDGKLTLSVQDSILLNYYSFERTYRSALKKSLHATEAKHLVVDHTIH
jgi:hypothetical protein